MIFPEIKHDSPNGYPRHASCLGSFLARHESRHGQPSVIADVGQKIIAFPSERRYLCRMPLVFEKDGFRFAFYSNDHRPIHVHVRKGDGEAIFNVEDLIELRESAGMKVRDLARAQELAEENKEIIIQKWHEHLG
jgi:hypothetical protein